MNKIHKVLSLGVKNETIEIVPFGDIHYGSKCCRIDKFKRLVDWVKSKPNTYMIGMGDLIDCIIPKDKRFDIDSGDEYNMIDDLVEDMEMMLAPIKSRIICMLMGNHEYHMFKDGYGDPIKKICKNLCIPYGGFSSFIKLSISPRTHCKSLVIWAHHGWFAGRKRGGKVNNLEDNMANYDADIYLAGHSHDLWATRKSRVYWSGSRDVIFGNTGSFLETASKGTISYAERANYPPQKLGVLKIKWLPRQEKIYASE